MIDEAGWHTEEGRLFEHNRHYCDKCHWVDDADEMHLRIERKDIVSKRDIAQLTPSSLSPEIGEGGEMARHKDIPAEDMAKLYKYCETWKQTTNGVMLMIIFGILKKGLILTTLK